MVINVFSGTTGSVLFLSGVVAMAAAVALSLVSMATRNSRKKRLEDRMKEKYQEKVPNRRQIEF